MMVTLRAGEKANPYSAIFRATEKGKPGQNKFTCSETFARKVLKGAEREKEKEREPYEVNRISTS